LEEAFLTHGIPYQVLGVRFFERKEVKDVLSYMRAALNPDSLLDIKRTINTPVRGIGKVTIAKLFAAPSIMHALAGEGEDPLTGKALHSVTNFFNLLERIRDFIETHSVSESIRYIITESGMVASYKGESDGEERLENLEELVTLGVRYDAFGAEEGLEKLLEDATLMSDQDNLEAAKGVKLMTIHASKGLEFNIVFVTGLEFGLFPHERDQKLTGSDAEEERRLMYVALTRARAKLYLTYASMRTIFGMRDVRLPSEFISDIPDEFIERESRQGEAGFTTVYL
ncbi:ATP-dependent helicase, partial [Patescibacteria group bacterium]|nr:ATP-dependent helicase [Patescibacteria group bacterium]